MPLALPVFSVNGGSTGTQSINEFRPRHYCCMHKASHNPYESTTTAKIDSEPHLQPTFLVASSAAIAICLVFIVVVCAYGKPTVTNGNVRFQFADMISLLPASDPYMSSVWFVETTILVGCLIVCGLVVATLIATNLIADVWRRARSTWFRRRTLSSTASL